MAVRERWGFAPNPTRKLSFLDFPLGLYRFAIKPEKSIFKPPRSGEGSLRDNVPQWGLGQSPNVPPLSP